MRSSSRKTVWLLLTTALVWSICDIGYSGPSNNRQVAVIDLGEPGVIYDYVQETQELSPGTPLSVSWLGAQNEDAFLVVDTSILDKSNWALEDSQTGARRSGLVLLQTHIAVRNASEKRRTYTNLLGMLQAFDVNGDKRIDAGDFLYAALRLYRDDNGDGKIDSSELSSLEEEDIAELVLIVNGAAKRDPQGNLCQVIKVKKTDGSKTVAHLVTLRPR